MKKLLFILAVVLTSCTAEPIESDSTDYLQNNSPQCGLIVEMGHYPEYDYIDVRMDYQQPYEKNRYKVDNYMDYKGNTKICDFNGLQQIEW